jgi:hypothetical protein
MRPRRTPSTAQELEVDMARKCRLTSSRTSYLELEVEAGDRPSAGPLLVAAMAQNAELCESGKLVGGPVFRIVETPGTADEDTQAA